MTAIRNFSIIAHIDHGKTTLTDRFLRLTHTVSDLQFRDRMMDSNPIEQERGITIKLAPVRMEYVYHGSDERFILPNNEPYIMNLIDTPGHVDFGYEVSRSLAACEGVVLVVDATQGIQAQTLSNYEKARELGLVIIPVLNKIDLPGAEVEQVMLECMETFGIKEEDIVSVSAKTGLNIERVLEAVIERIPAPTGSVDEPLQALVVTSKFDAHRGAIAYVRVMNGTLKAKDKLGLKATNMQMSPIEVGVFKPAMLTVNELNAGEVGYVATGLKDIRLLKVGDTVTSAAGIENTPALPGYREPTPMVFMELYPIDTDEYEDLQEGMSKLAMHDASLQFSPVHSTALGNGLRVGFLGILHAEIIRERLDREFQLDLIATAPSVSYRVLLHDGSTLTVNSPAQMPDPTFVKEIQEPMAQAIIFMPEKYLSPVNNLVRERRGEFVNNEFVGDRVRAEYVVPLAEIITDFHDTLKSLTAGFASLEYQLTHYVAVDAVKVSIMLAGEEVEALSFMTVRDQAESQGRALVTKLKDVIPRQMFEVPIQAAIGGTIIARETLKAFRKDVTAHLYGGDNTRRMKLLKKQAKGKKKMKQLGKVELNQEAFLAVLKK